MTFVEDIAMDFVTVADGLLPVKLRARDGQERTAQHCLRRGISQREAAKSNGKYTTDDVAFHLSIREIPGRPELGSLIIDDSGEWTILEVGTQTINSRWRCVSRDLAIVEGLDTLVTRQVATYAKGDTGAQEPTWANDATNVRCKIQLLEGERKTDHKSPQLKRTAVLYFATQALVTTKHRFVDSGGVIYKVISWKDPDTITDLFAVTCEVTKWPLS